MTSSSLTPGKMSALSRFLQIMTYRSYFVPFCVLINQHYKGKNMQARLEINTARSLPVPDTPSVLQPLLTSLLLPENLSRNPERSDLRGTAAHFPICLPPDWNALWSSFLKILLVAVNSFHYWHLVLPTTNSAPMRTYSIKNLKNHLEIYSTLKLEKFGSKVCQGFD